MTCIAWDGKNLAGDRRITQGTFAYTGDSKVHEINGYLVGVAGVALVQQRFLEWARSGWESHLFPREDVRDYSFTALVVTPAKEVLRYEAGPNPIKIIDVFHAIGSGASIAMGAMASGKTAQEAVEIACKFDSNCCGPVDVVG